MLNKPENDTALILLIRHGATDANLQRPYILQGRSLNGPLSQTGIEQVSSAGKFLSNFPLDHVYASPMVRAQQSAELIAQHHGHTVKTIDDIIEVDVGDWEAKSWDVIMQEDPEQYKKFMANPAEVPYKGGECYRDVQQRVVPAFNKLAADHLGEMVAVVAHNVVNRAILAYLLALDLNRAKDIRQNNACVNIIRYKQNRLELITLNAVFHLGDV